MEKKGEEKSTKKMRVDQEMLSSAKDFILFSFTLKDGRCNGLWAKLSPAWQEDREVAAAALHNRCVNAAELPDILRNDRAFLSAAFQANSEIYYGLPTSLKEDFDFVMQVETFHDYNFVKAVLEAIPQIGNERKIWEMVFNVKCDARTSDLSSLFSNFASDEVKSDRALMLRGCYHDHALLECIHDLLKQDRQFVAAILEKEPLTLASLPTVSQVLFPDLMADHVLPFALRFPKPNSMRSIELGLGFLDSSSFCCKLVRLIAPELWSNAQFVDAWFGAGGLYYWDLFPDTLRTSEKIFLLMAEHCTTVALLSMRGFSQCCWSLRRDKDFMMKAVKKNGNLLFCTTRDLMLDFDLTVAACSNVRNFWKVAFSQFKSMELSHRKTEKHFAKFTQTILNKLESQDTFLRSFLGAITRPSLQDHGGRCVLPLLNQGSETAIAHKRTIAEFLGIPMGNELWVLRQAAANINVPGTVDLSAKNYDSDSDDTWDTFAYYD